MSTSRPRTQISENGLLHLAFLQPGKDMAMSTARAVFDSGFPVKDSHEMVGRAISLCVHYGQKIGRLSLVSHGSSGRFYIGEQAIAEPYLKPNYKTKSKSQTEEYGKIYFALSSLKPYFASGAYVFIYGCESGSGTDGPKLLRALSELWGVPVLARTGIQQYSRNFVDRPELEFEEGWTVVCTRQACGYY
jgi:Domain of unknown function (DUF4347)